MSKNDEKQYIYRYLKSISPEINYKVKHGSNITLEKPDEPVFCTWKKMYVNLIMKGHQPSLSEEQHAE